MGDIEVYIVEEGKESKKFIEISCEDYRNYLLLSDKTFDFICFLREAGYLAYKCDFKIIDKIDIKEF